MAWAILAAAVTTAVLAIYLTSPEPDPLSPSALEMGASPPLGDADAPLIMIEWGDYQCTYCYRFHQSTFESIRRDYVETGIVQVMFHDFPLNGPDSEMAAHAAMCAREQGLYWEYHDVLYLNWAGERTGWITEHALYGFALDAGLQSGPYSDCMVSGRYAEDISASYEYSRSIGIDATPSFIIHDGERAIKIVGNQPVAVFNDVIQEMYGE